MSLEYLSDRDRAVSNDDASRILACVSASPVLRVLKSDGRTLLFDDRTAGEELGRFDVEDRGVYLAFRGGGAAWNQEVRGAVQTILNELGGFSVLELE